MRTSGRRHRFLGVGAVVIAIVLLGVLWVQQSATGGVVRSFWPLGTSIALTFDDGPDPAYTPAVLDILREHDVRATFFVVGDAAARYPELVERMVAEGHEVAFHSQTHSHVDLLSEREMHGEIREGLTLLDGQGVTPLWYRPPRGSLTDAQTDLAAAHGMKVALWSRCMERARFSGADEMAATLAEETRPGDVVLAHDGLGDRSMTLEALPVYLEALHGRGIDVVTLSQLEELTPMRIFVVARAVAASCGCTRLP